MWCGTAACRGRRECPRTYPWLQVVLELHQFLPPLEWAKTHCSTNNHIVMVAVGRAAERDVGAEGWQVLGKEESEPCKVYKWTSLNTVNMLLEKH